MAGSKLGTAFDATRHIKFCKEKTAMLIVLREN